MNEKIILDTLIEKIKKGDIQLVDVPEEWRAKVEALLQE
jgi:hypothetical protein